MPHTKFFDTVVSQLGTKANWDESGDLSMMFRGTYSTEFYRALADVLHLEVRDGPHNKDLQDAWNRVRELERESIVEAGVPA